MANSKVSLSMRSENVVRDGEIVMAGGTAISVSTDDIGSLTVSTDYTNEDALIIGVGGNLDLKVIGAEGATVHGQLSHDILNNVTKVKGGLKFKIDKNTSADITTEYSAQATKVQATMTIKF